MSRIGIIMVVALCTGILTRNAVAAAFTPTLQAQSTLNGAFTEPNPRIVDSGVVPCDSDAQEAEAKDEITFSAPPPDAHTVTGYQDCSVYMGYIRQYMQLSAQGNEAVGMTGILTATCIDQVTIGLGDQAPKAGTIDLTPVISGNITNTQGTYGGFVSLVITIKNSGSAATPKDLSYTIQYRESWGQNGSGITQSGPSSMAVSLGDVITITMVQLLSDYAMAKGAYSSITANYGQSTHFYIDSKTPGLTLTAASGHDYSTPRSAAHKLWALYE